MSKKYGLISDFALIRKDMSRTVIGYGLTPEEDGEHATWHEVVIYKKKIANPNIDDVKDAVRNDINARTDEKILTGFVWNGKPVYLSEENQKNFSEAQRIAVMTEGQSLPVKFKLGEDADGNPVYHTFTAVNSINQFYLAAVAYIQECLVDGWTQKDSIDWSEYEEALENPVIDGMPEPEPEPEPEPSGEEQEAGEATEDAAEGFPEGEVTEEETPESEETPEETSDEPSEEAPEETTEEEPQEEASEHEASDVQTEEVTE